MWMYWDSKWNMSAHEYREDDEIIVQKEFLVQDPDGYLLRFTC